MTKESAYRDVARLCVPNAGWQRLFGEMICDNPVRGIRVIATGV